ncbi:hypothetical protein PUN28_003390 [Cardiocondyla obscurior]|uniref:Uncharacterized protein n=1 Tax=Cardiocondyla obscurior TaxID=286306 RepID=A0AAW2GKN7_9HYME
MPNERHKIFSTKVRKSQQKIDRIYQFFKRRALKKPATLRANKVYKRTKIRFRVPYIIRRSPSSLPYSPNRQFAYVHPYKRRNVSDVIYLGGKMNKDEHFFIVKLFLYYNNFLHHDI